MNDDPVNPNNNEHVNTEVNTETGSETRSETSTGQQVSAQSQTYTSQSSLQETSTVASQPAPQPVKAVNLAPLGAWMSLLMLGTLGLMGYGYYQLNQKISSLESNLGTLRSTVTTTPTATVDAIVAWQEGMQQQQAQEQARAQQRQQGLSVDEEIAEIKAGEALSTSITNEHATIGPEEATVVLMEFSDLNCGFCARYHAETMPKIIENYVDTGKIRYVYRDYVGVGGQVSQQASTSARCLREDVDDSTYLNYVRAIYAIQGRKDSNNVSALAKEFGAGDNFETCAEEGRYADAVQRDTTTGQKLGIRGTPGFIIGFAQEDGTVEGINVQGALPYEVFERYLDGFLAEADTSSNETIEVAGN